MTGIAAIFAPGPAREGQIDRMLAAMSERVRDVSGTWAAAPFALGAHVLHTTAESLEAAQPLVSKDGGVALVMDGYLTNWEELRRDLTERGAVLRNRSDAELVLCAYEQWGEDCANRLEGEFAIVIADRRQHRIYAVRDHQGLRPLFVYEDGEALLFASDIAAIVAAAGRKPMPNYDYLANIVGGHWFLPNATVWKGLDRVPQAHWLSWDGNRRTARCYYDLPTAVTLHYRRESDYVHHYREVLFDAVRRTARSHRPLAVAVSGGLDSSSIFCVADALERQGDLPAPGLQGYTLVGEPGSDAYELPYARAAADHCRRSLVEAPLFRPGVEWFTARGAADCDIPVPHNAAMSITLEQCAQANGARVWLDGQGGDERLDGTSEYYTEFARAFDIPGFAAALLRDARADGWRRTVPVAVRFALAGFTPLALRRMVWRHRRERCYRNPDDLFWLKPEWRERLLGFEENFTAALPEDRHARGNWNRLLSPYSQFAFDIMQRQRARAGLEARNPMLTCGFIAFCSSAPKWIFLQGGLTKSVHRKAMRGILPDLIVDRTSKAEFSAPTVTRAFAQAVQAADPAWLEPICDADGLIRLTQPGKQLSIDPYRGWEIWGAYAVAAFLAECTFSSTGAHLDRSSL